MDPCVEVMAWRLAWETESDGDFLGSRGRLTRDQQLAADSSVRLQMATRGTAQLTSSGDTWLHLKEVGPTAKRGFWAWSGPAVWASILGSPLQNQLFLLIFFKNTNFSFPFFF